MDEQLGPCRYCGHEHPTMARVTVGQGRNEPETFWLCHEEDHSCYEEYGRRRLRGKLAEMRAERDANQGDKYR